MTRIRKCKNCGRTERQTYISSRLLCKRCAVESATNIAARNFDLARKLPKRTDDSFDAGQQRMIEYLVASHEDGVRRRKAQQAARRG